MNRRPRRSALAPPRLFFFFFNDTATTEIYTLSLHDALPISPRRRGHLPARHRQDPRAPRRDRKSTRLNSSHQIISYAVFCLKKKKQRQNVPPIGHAASQHDHPIPALEDR